MLKIASDNVKNEYQIHCSDETGNLISLKDLDSWKTLLDAAVTRNHEGILDIAKTLKEGELPQILYHKKCRAIVMLKRDLQKLAQSDINSKTQVTKVATDLLSHNR